MDPAANVARLPTKPNLIIRNDDLTVTARALAAIIACSGRIFVRDVPVKIVDLTGGGMPRAMALAVDGIVIEAHALARPVFRNRDGSLSPCTLPDRVARLYLALGDWGLPPLNGITTAPLLSADGAMRAADGYDAHSGTWCANVPATEIAPSLSLQEAQASLRVIRETFCTFPFADAATVEGLHPSVPVIDLSVSPAFAESALIAALLTAICRPSLRLAPGLLISAPSESGAGTGKGLLVRAISMIAFGTEPRAFNAGYRAEELEKRLVAALMEAAPVLFLDNVNSKFLRSELLASILTESPVVARVLNFSRMVRLNSAAFVAVTGNGIMLTEDLTRRFIPCELDAHMEDPKRRPFLAGFLEGIKERRSELLTAALTIWKWGRPRYCVAGGRLAATIATPIILGRRRFSLEEPRELDALV
jgi:hypothetical protein